MRKILIYLIICFFIQLALTTNVISQENESKVNCKVLVDALSDKYEGSCKKGLAHGKGIATGIDTYKGKFKNGFPHGQGVYTWKNGDIYDGNWKEGKRDGKGEMYYKSIKQDSILYAYWVEDKFVKEIEIAPYEITYKTSNLSRVLFKKENSERNDIELVVIREGRVLRSLDYIDFVGNSGVLKQTMSYTGYEYVNFPFEGQIRFKASDKLNTVVYEYILRFAISAKGSWKISIYI